MAEVLQGKEASFYQRFLMARGHFHPRDFGVDLEKSELQDAIVEDFSALYWGEITVDELLLRPRTGLYFCDLVRTKHQWFDLPDDIILRLLLAWRKHGGDGRSKDAPAV